MCCVRVAETLWLGPFVGAHSSPSHRQGEMNSGCAGSSQGASPRANSARAIQKNLTHEESTGASQAEISSTFSASQSTALFVASVRFSPVTIMSSAPVKSCVSLPSVGNW